MLSGEFTITFSYGDVAYVGLVKPLEQNGEIWYMVGLESEIAIGVLIAPDKGSETLKKIRSRINDYTDQAADEATEGVDDLADGARAAIKKAKRKANESFE